MNACRQLRFPAITLILSLCVLYSSYSSAANVPFSTLESSSYLIIATERISGNTDVDTSNFELGANKAPVPSTDSFLDGGSSGGPTLLGAVPDLPSGIRAVDQGIGGHGNVAVTDTSGEFNFQNVGVYADPGIGIRVAGSSESLNKSSNSFFNDPNMFPNTFSVATQTGTDVNPNDADQNTRIEASGNGHPSDNVGVTYSFDHSSLITELATARTSINSLTSTGTLDASGGNAGQLETGSTLSGNASLVITTGNSLGGIDARLTLDDGLNVIDISTGGNDFLLNNANLIVDGPEFSTVIFRMPNNDNMLITNSNILVGNGGIGRNDILFYTDQNQNDTHFSFSNSIINGAAFWSLGDSGGTIGVSNAQGSTQLVADIVTMSNVRFTRWSFAPVPEPSAIALFCFGGIALLSVRCS